jgi:predicted RNase H-like HicB family nuclease
MQERTLTLEYWKDAEWFVGQIREVPGIISQGATLEELEQNMQDAYQLMMEERRSLSPPQAKTKPIAIPA